MKMTEDETNALLERAGVDPIEDVDTGNLLDVIIKLQTRIDDALENIKGYIPEFILEEGNARSIDGQVRGDPKREYHPESSVDSFREDLKRILTGHVTGLAEHNCPHCYRSFTTPEGLRLHVSLAHADKGDADA